MASTLTLPAVSLFSNCGAGDLGFRQAGFEFVVMAELKPQRLAVALRNHPTASGVQGDLRQTWPEVVEEWRSKRGSAIPALLAACPPCQGMSTARSDRGLEDDPDAGSKDERNLLVMPIARVASRLKPQVIVVENVPAFLRRKVRHPSTGDPVSAAALLAELLTCEYEAYPFESDLADYGVPQRRKRAFLTFIRRDHKANAQLTASKRTPYPLPSHAIDHGGSPVSLASALSGFGLPRLNPRSPETAMDPDRPLHQVPVWSQRQIDMVSAIPPNSGATAWQNDECSTCGKVAAEPDDAECPKCSGPLLRPVVATEDGFRLVKGFRRSSYRRMAPELPAATITTASGRVGSSHTLHPVEPRVLSPLECALLQTITEDFDWGETLSTSGVGEIRAMIGEAVPPLFTRRHGERLADLLCTDVPIDALPSSDPRVAKGRGKLGFGS